MERLAIEIRHLQRTELLEVEEFFDQDQKGSSAMPHKRNPILSENITGIARYIRGSIIPILENVALWHERDMSHSSVERILAPDVTIATDFALSRLSSIIKNLIVYPENMKKNLNKLGKLHKSQEIMIHLIQKGLSRIEAYTIVQKLAKKSWNSNEKFENILKDSKEINKYISKDDLKKMINTQDDIKYIDDIFTKAFELD